MSIPVKSLEVQLRDQGINYGLPMLHLELGKGKYYEPDDLIKEIIQSNLGKKSWILIFGEEDPLSIKGMGTFCRALSVIGLNIEMETSGQTPTPGWFMGIDRWVVDYTPDGAFNYGALRSTDMVRFHLPNYMEGCEKLKMFPGTKYLIVADGNQYGEIFSTACRYQRTRLYIK